MHIHLLNTYGFNLTTEFITHVNHQLNSGIDYENLDQKKLIREYDSVKQRYFEMEDGAYKNIDIYTLTDSNELIIDFEEIFKKYG